MSAERTAIPSSMEIKALRALGDESRLRITLALWQRELCVCQIIELLELAPSTVSKHLLILKEAGLVESRKQGRWVHYRANPQGARGIPAGALELILTNAGKSEQAKRDSRSLQRILELDPEELCERQRKC